MKLRFQQRGDELVLRKRPKTLAGAFYVLTALSADMFRNGRNQPKIRKPRMHSRSN